MALAGVAFLLYKRSATPATAASAPLSKSVQALNTNAQAATNDAGSIITAGASFINSLKGLGNAFNSSPSGTVQPTVKSGWNTAYSSSDNSPAMTTSAAENSYYDPFANFSPYQDITPIDGVTVAG